jgi:hypothetical protein
MQGRDHRNSEPSGGNRAHGIGVLEMGVDEIGSPPTELTDRALEGAKVPPGRQTEAQHRHPRFSEKPVEAIIDGNDERHHGQLQPGQRSRPGQFDEHPLGSSGCQRMNHVDDSHR